tara:strand:- start:259 stop:1113 length:855 start_codon:yes stop_codon:yes gene_type:complete
MNKVGITIYEVGPRDGLQTIKKLVPTRTKRALINALRSAGLRSIETVSFAHPLHVPQMADAEQVFDGEGAALVMNQRGMDRALKSGVTHFNIVFSPSNEFNLRNLGCELKEAILRYAKMLDGTPKANVRVYISCFFGCPYEGEMSMSKRIKVIQAAKLFGDTVVLADTVGVGTQHEVEVGAGICDKVGIKAALHLHHRADREEHALSLVRKGIECGITEFDASIGGLGGCPFVEGSPGNLSTESLVRWLAFHGHDCGVSIDDLANAKRIALSIAEPFLPPTLSV